ncbi:MAG: hypothetical protein EBZ48_00760 [Proteobacteria bacterium]|nr:hypothetical protein [Pseudomonadota bacterium]
MRSDSNSLPSRNTQSPRENGAGTSTIKTAQARPFAYDGAFFCSRSEAACATLMKKYLGFACLEGETFQVPMGHGSTGQIRHFDFLVFDTVLEFHPFHPPKDPLYWRLLRRLPPGQRDQLRRVWSHNDEVHYYDTRRAQLNQCPHLRRKELIVARSPEDFYEKVIVRFMREKHLAPFRRIPEREQFLREFREILGQVTELNVRKAAHLRVRPAHERNRRMHG